MKVSYKKMWVLCAEKEMSKAELRRRAGLSSATFTKLRKNQEVTIAVMLKLADVLDCNAGDMMDSCEEMMIQDWHGALYKKDDTAYLCFTYDPEVTYVLEYTPSKMSDADIIKMAESVEPIEEE